MDDLSAILASIFSSGTFNDMLRRATPVALAALGGRVPLLLEVCSLRASA